MVLLQFVSGFGSFLETVLKILQKQFLSCQVEY